MTFTGVGHLVRLVLRRDRVRIAVWTLALAALVAISAASVVGLYDTPESLAEYAALIDGNAVLIVQSGPGYGLDDDPTTGAVLMNELGIWVIVAVSVMSVFMVTRHTRAEEESERIELLRAGPVGRHAPAAAAMTGVSIANVAVAAGVVVVLWSTGFGGVGAVAFGLALVGAGTVFAALALVAAQVVSTARAATGSAAAAIGVAFVLRAVGDIGDGWQSALSWMSPIGWAQAVRPFAGERWWVLLLPLVASIGLVALAEELTSRRDLGAGLIRQRLGPAEAGPRLSSVLALAVRLQRGALFGWSVGVFAFGVFYGVVADEAASLLGDNPELADFFTQLGDGSITDAFLATSVLMLALAATGFTVSSVLRLRSEETSGRVDPLLATPVSRRRWAASHLVVAVVGTVVVLGAGGLGVGVGFAAASGDGSQVPRMLGAALVLVPAALVLGGLAFALVGAAPRLAVGVWGAFAIVVALGVIGGLLDLPDEVLAVSPFRHVPAVPAAPVDVAPLALLSAVAALLVVAGAVGIGRRDLA